MKNYLLLSTVLICLSTPAFAQISPSPAPTPAAPVPIPTTPAKAAADMQQQVNTALTEYQQKNYGKAADALDAASLQLRKLKSDALVQFLPAAPKGWTTKEDSSALYRTRILGNGSLAEREYLSGGEEVKVSIITDSKLKGAIHDLQTSGNPPMQFLGHDYMFKTADPSAPSIIQRSEANLYVSKNLTISVSGKMLTDQQAQGFISLIDLEKLKTEADK